MLRFSSTVRSGSEVRAWGMTPITRLTSSGSLATSKPATNALPLVMGTRVVIMRMSVLLPAPLGPSRPKISPSATEKLTPLTASKAPKRLTMFSTAMAATADDEGSPTRLTSVVALAGEFIASPACSSAHGRGSFYVAIEPVAGSLLHQLVLWHINIGGHAGDKALSGIVNEQLDLDGLDVALGSAVD